MLAKTLVDEYYGDLRAMTIALAEVLHAQVSEIEATIVQVDEANLPGHPEDVSWAHEPINHVLSAIHGEKALHLCFGNYGGQSIQVGFWADMLGFLNNLDVDHLVLEFARRGDERTTGLQGSAPGYRPGYWCDRYQRHPDRKPGE